MTTQLKPKINLAPISMICKFLLGENVLYVSNGTPLGAHAYYCNSNEDIGMWNGKTNTVPEGEAVPSNAFWSVDQAIAYMRKEAANNPRYKGGFVVDYSTGTLYYDNDLFLRYFKNRKVELAHFSNRIERSWKD